MIHAASLSQTIDEIQEALFEQRKLTAAERKRAAQWLAARQGLPGAYGETFAGFAAERTGGIVVFTGERITSASARHILGEEACRALRLLRVRDPAVQQALERASAGVRQFLERAARDPRNLNPGCYCCGKCTVSLWRNVLAGNLDRREERLRRGIDQLRVTRDGAGQWQRFPFWYTVLALSEAEVPEALKELKYAAPLLERTARRRPAASRYAQRRHRLAQLALQRL